MLGARRNDVQVTHGLHGIPGAKSFLQSYMET
jgi:hypothetical protein